MSKIDGIATFFINVRRRIGERYALIIHAEDFRAPLRNLVYTLLAY